MYGGVLSCGCSELRTPTSVYLAQATPFCNCKPFLDCSQVQWNVFCPRLCSLPCPREC